ncbi:dicarboxylate/amino acid:cation symporter [Candidatus Gracilibacteria bacterium 28_42_T64]|nr:dicarboxylate/amino acid:cation symporter [Candidatus Gracilibacteria bacterium 28_42_T64]
MKKNPLKRLETQVIISLILAIIAGIYLPQIVPYISWMGEIFMKMLKVFLAPLLFFSVFIAVLGLGDFKKLGNIGARTMGYYMLTTVLAISVSLILMNVFTPGVGSTLGIEAGFNAATIESLTFSAFIQSLIPSNIFVAFVEFNAMQIVTCGIVLGISVLAGGKMKKIDHLKNITETINNGILKFIEFVIKLTPFGVFAIVAKVVSEHGIESMINLLPFVYVILLALFIHAFITLPSIGFIIGGFNPYHYFLKVKEAILVGFSTSSSSATMGLSMSVAKNKAKLSEEVVDFTFPIGTTINMDGTALYQAGVALFVAQVLGVDLTIIAQLTIVAIVILASIGAAGVPGAGILILTTVFLTIGLPVEAIGIILAVDRILDMFRTGVNVWGDLLTAKVVDKFYRKNLTDKALKKIEELKICEKSKELTA